MIHHCHKGVVALHPAPPLVPTLALVWQSNRPKQFINGRKLTWHKKSSVTLATQISFTQGQINVRLGEDGGTCQGGMWVGVFSSLDRRELLHQLKLSCIPGRARLSHFALEETSVSLHQPLHAECSSYIQHHFNVLPSISTGKWTLGTTCTEVVNNSPHGTHPTRRAQATFLTQAREILPSASFQSKYPLNLQFFSDCLAFIQSYMIARQQMPFW